MNRRHFIKQSGLLLASTPFVFDHSGSKGVLGVQLWCVQKSLNANFEATIAQVAELGYTHVESAGYNAKDKMVYKRSLRAFADAVRAHGLNPITAHTSFTLDEADAVLDDFASIDTKYVVWPSLRRELRNTADGYRQAADELNAIGEKAKARGIRLGYHNHNFEFDPFGNEIPYDILLDHTDAELVFFEMDLGWLVKGGYQPVDYFQRYPGRFPLWHIRDINEAGDSVAVGSGKLDFGSILSQRRIAGYQLGIVETQVAPATSIQPIIDSYQFLVKNNLICT